MAFITHPLPVSSTSKVSARSQCKRRVVKAIASESKPSRVVKAPVVASRVAGVSESHHWIHVKGDVARAFERAAAANASVTALVEERAGVGARRRWVLRRVADPSLDFVNGALTNDLATFVVMEQWDDTIVGPDHAHTHRWLSAVRRVGPMLGAIDIQTLSYQNIFRARKVNSPPNPDGCIIVIESINVNSPEKNVEQIREILSTTAQASVSTGECLEFSVLESISGNFFKTVEVYQDAQALRKHMEDGIDRSFVTRTRGKIMGEHRERQTFKASHLA